MATENVNQSGASAAADSAKEETVTPDESTGPDTAAVEPHAAADTNQTAHSELTPVTRRLTATTASDPSPQRGQQPHRATANGPQRRTGFQRMLDDLREGKRGIPPGRRDRPRHRRRHLRSITSWSTSATSPRASLRARSSSIARAT